MPAPAFRLLEYVFLALLYLFFLRVVRAVWVELREPRMVNTRADLPGSDAVTVATGTVPGAQAATPAAAPRPEARKRGLPGHLALANGGPVKGPGFALDDEMTIGRAPGCAVVLPDDTFVSQLHARVFFRGDGYWVEDLGSTNGTLLNGRRVMGSLPLQRGDRLQVGKTVLEVQK
jgi:hypothetical protein